MPTPPLRAPDGVRRLLDACTASSLLAIDADQDPPRLFVHRWTASELEPRWAESGRGEQLTAAHLRAAEYWRWRVQVWPQDRASDLDDLTEARHHLFAAGQTEQANQLTWAICNTLHAWGAWDREDALIRDTLAQLLPTPTGAPTGSGNSRTSPTDGPGSPTPPGCTSRPWPSTSSTARLDPATPDFQRALSISYERLADLASAAGDTGEAEQLYRQALAIDERLAVLDPGNTDFQRNLSVSYSSWRTWPALQGTPARPNGCTGRPWPSPSG